MQPLAEVDVATNEAYHGDSGAPATDVSETREPDKPTFARAAGVPLI